MFLKMYFFFFFVNALNPTLLYHSHRSNIIMGKFQMKSLITVLYYGLFDLLL